MDLTGQLIAESPIYRGNAVKTLFTRDGDGKQKLVSLPGKIDGTAQGLMDAFIDESRNKKNKGLLNKGWERFYGEEIPKKLINQVECRLNKKSYLRDRFFDLRMGIKLDEDRWAAANENYKMETVFKNAVFDFSISINAEELKKGENQAKLYYLLNEIKEGRFWFGAGKTKGLGNVRLEMDLSALKPKMIPSLKKGVNHLHLALSFDCMNPVLIGWNWGNKDSDAKGTSSGTTGTQASPAPKKKYHSDLEESDTWVDGEVIDRENHRKLKGMIQKGHIEKYQWDDKSKTPKGVEPRIWEDFVRDHEKKKKVEFHQMKNRPNLSKSIVNDSNFIDFLTSYRGKARQALSSDHHMDFRAGGKSKREISRKYGKPYDKIFMRMLTWAPSSNQEGKWEIYIPGSTIKGAFRKRASQILKTVIGESGKTEGLLKTLFGAQRWIGKVMFSDAYLTDPIDEEKAWCSVDGIKMDPKTARPLDNSKQDFLIGYGDHLKFNLKIDIQDISKRHFEALSVFFHLLGDFQRGDIPVGGDRNNGSGWIKAKNPELTWLTSSSDEVTEQLFENQPLTDDGIWKSISLVGIPAIDALKPFQDIKSQTNPGKIPERSGFISHRYFGGHCGLITVEAEVLTPLSIRESGEPSYTTNKNGEIFNGWDFFSLSPPAASHRKQDKGYAIPSRSIKGMLRHIYSITSDSRTASNNLSNLNPVDSLFGYVGAGSNNALASRLSFSFGLFDQPKLSWFKAPYFYGHQHFSGGNWVENPEGKAKQNLIDETWRVFPHVPFAPGVEEVPDFDPADPTHGYFRAMMPGSKARFSIRFWNLKDDELQRLVWCIMLEPGRAHKMGNRRYQGFGSIRLKLINPSYLIDWNKRYSGGSEKEWQKPFKIAINPNFIKHHSQLNSHLNDANIRQEQPKDIKE